MMRDELLRKIASLPAETDVGVQIGSDHLDVTEVIVWGGDEQFGALRCDPCDTHDLAVAWGLSPEMREGLASVADPPVASKISREDLRPEDVPE
jgi:hypothetical protein